MKGYEKKLAALHAAGVIQPGTVAVLDVRHEAWCPSLRDPDRFVLRGPLCECDPEIWIKGRRVEVPTT